MAKKSKNATPSSTWDSEVRLLAWLATCVSVMAFLFYDQRGFVLLYGDAVAHLNIARRVFDSKTPGLLQLGTVWLPLPHLLMVPFLLSTEMWRRGLGGSIPSMGGYVFAVVGIFRLVRGVFSVRSQADATARFAAHLAAWTAAGVFAANPNLIYMQATAMGESLYLAFFIWAIVYFAEALRQDGAALIKCGLCLAAACLTRYDGWFLSFVMVATVVMVSFLGEIKIASYFPDFRVPRSTVVKFVALSAAGPALWLAYNGIVYRNPLEFANGPYSARAIERKTQSVGNPGHPGSGDPLLAGRYFLKSAEANVAENEWLQRAWVLLLVAGIATAAWRSHRSDDSSPAPWPLLFLLVPVPFYALSVAYGGVPIFIPEWWPFSHYNVRYGLQLLPGFAVALAVLVQCAVRFQGKSRVRLAGVFILFAVVIASYATVWHAGPVSLVEAQVNMRSRKQLETQLATWLEKIPFNATLLMYVGDHVGALQQAGIPLRHVINEGNHRAWKQPSDPDGLWERSLQNPAQYADYVIAFEGDPVWQAIARQHLRELIEIHVTGQARAAIYQAR